ncbi:hypothetical protein [Beihai barnacle virus 3]|uniref:hypothetical protein n=1 Tax=Beihai barnacle virus 3 TaxID=1922361 RepID=UPI00090AB8CE|nr:hypothetical protein [Beihai barnacle virus 3]APG77566.1 hypothetical protein [Beihai barnacle virus 3]
MFRASLLQVSPPLYEWPVADAEVRDSTASIDSGINQPVLGVKAILGKIKDLTELIEGEIVDLAVVVDSIEATTLEIAASVDVIAGEITEIAIATTDCAVALDSIAVTVDLHNVVPWPCVGI